MNTHQPNQNQELDLSVLSYKISQFRNSCYDNLFKCLQYLKKYFVVFLILVISAGIWGYFKDNSDKVYTHELIVRTNFDSYEYFNSKVEFLNSRLKERDADFFKSIGVNNYKSISKIKTEPVIDIYPLVSEKGKPRNYDVLKLLVDNGDLSKVLKDGATSRYYPMHQLTFIGKGKIEYNTSIEKIIDYLNSDTYYKELMSVFVENSAEKFKNNQLMIEQIDAILQGVASAKNQQTDKLFFNNEHSDLNSLLKFKEDLLIEQAKIRADRLDFDKIIKVKSIDLNIEKKAIINISYMIFAPIIMVVLFFFAIYLISIFKKQYARFKQI